LSSKPEFHELYNWTKTLNFNQLLENIRIFLVGRLEIIYRFKHDPLIWILKEEKFCSVLTTNESQSHHLKLNLYIRRDFPDRQREICQYFTKIFLNRITNSCDTTNTTLNLERTLANLIVLLNDELKDLNNIETFAKYKQFQLQLPNDEKKWSMPMKEIPYQPIHNQSNVDECAAFPSVFRLC